jgi:hypothetical protein
VLATLPDLEDWMRVSGAVSVSEAARVLGISRQGVTDALRHGRMTALCAQCGQTLARALMRREPNVVHLCSRDGTYPRATYPVVIAPQEVHRYRREREREGRVRARGA